MPWWQELEPILAVRPDVVLLRLLHAEPAPGHPAGGRVTYLAEVGDPPPGLLPVDPGSLLDDHPLRAPWARPGGWAADLAWAGGHVELTGEPQQIRAWNLSSIWRLPTADGPVWLKCVPPFFAHEAEVLRLLGPTGRVPRLLAADRHRMLLANLPGRDGYEADLDERLRIVDVVVDLQLGTVGTEGMVPDWRGPALREAAADVVGRRRPGSEPLARLLATWDERFDAIAACGLPDVLFHGDVHPVNARIGIDPPVVFDWGDSGLGHPLLDLASADKAGDDELVRHWLDRWAAAVPGSEPDRAWELLRPVAALRMAVVYQRFLDGIEPSERVYHHLDVDPALDRAETLLAR